MFSWGSQSPAHWLLPTKITPNDLPTELVRIISSFLGYYDRTHLYCTLDRSDFPSKKFTEKDLDGHMCVVQLQKLELYFNKTDSSKTLDEKAVKLIILLEVLLEDLSIKIFSSKQHNYNIQCDKMIGLSNGECLDACDLDYKKTIILLSEKILKKYLDHGYKEYNYNKISVY